MAKHAHSCLQMLIVRNACLWDTHIDLTPCAPWQRQPEGVQQVGLRQFNVLSNYCVVSATLSFS